MNSFSDEDRQKSENRLPLKLIFLLAIKGFLIPFGLVFLIVGIFIVSSVGIGLSDTIKHLPFVFGNATENGGRATVVSYTPTTSKENKRIIYLLTYNYTVNGITYTGKAYSSDPDLGINRSKTYQVQYLRDAPEVSQINGFRSTKFSLIGILLFMLFPIIGAFCLVSGIITLLNTLQIIVFGKSSQATVISTQETNIKINRVTLFKVLLEYTTHKGERLQANITTSSPELFPIQSVQSILYNSIHPNKILALKDQPQEIQRFITKEIG